MKFVVQLQSFSTSINLPLFNSTRKFFKLAGVPYTVDMKMKTIAVNNGKNSAFLIRFDTHNYVRITSIPNNFRFEVLFQANTPHGIVRKLFDYKFVRWQEVNEMLITYNKDQDLKKLKKSTEQIPPQP